MHRTKNNKKKYKNFNIIAYVSGTKKELPAHISDDVEISSTALFDQFQSRLKLIGTPKS